MNGTQITPANLPPNGAKVTADDGNTYRVVFSSHAGAHTRRAFPHVLADLGIVLDSARAKTCYQAALHTDGSVVKIQSLGPWKAGE